ncbi:MAG: DMT family transporter [Xanthobacteraceae bacterium]
MDSNDTRLGRRFVLGPGIVAAIAFAFSDVFSKFVFAAGGDVLTLALIRGVVGLGILFVYLRVGPAPAPQPPRIRAIALGLGVLFAAIVYGLFKAIDLITVPIAVLTYYIYPLLTGLGGWLLGVERLSWSGSLAAIAAFCGLALMIGAYPQHLSVVGVALALGAAVSRAVFLLVARTELQNTDPRLTTWYSLVSSTAIFALAAAISLDWQPPQTGPGWIAILLVSITTAAGILMLYVSADRLGPFRTALIMNLEPLLATLLSAPLLGEVITPVQALGGALMLAALVAFQLWH